MNDDNRTAKPRIIVDSDWKEQAAREKEQLSAKFDEPRKVAAEAPAPQQPHEAAQGGEDVLPEPDFLNHCASLATQAMILLGAVRDPYSGGVTYDPVHARFLIDTLTMLKAKTKGNLTVQEDKSLDQLIGELKVAWLQITQAHAKAAEKAAKK